MAGYEVTNAKGERGWWDGKKVTMLDANGMPVSPSAAASAPDPQAQFDDARMTMKLIDDAERRVGFLSTGQLGRWGRGEKTDAGRKGGWGGSPGYELEEAFMPLRARIKLQNAGAAKSQGVSLAPMSNTDAASLEATLGSLDVGRKEQEIRATLNDVRAATARRQKGLTATNVFAIGQDAPETIPQGALFMGPDGLLYTNTLKAGFRSGTGKAPPRRGGGQVQGGGGKPPPGVSAAEWSAMTPQERALFK